MAAFTACFLRWGVFDVPDEGVLLAQALRVAHGERPFVDFHTGYGPAYFAFTGALVGRGGLIAVRAAFVVAHALTAGLLWTAVRRVAGTTWAVAATLVLAGFLLPVAPAQGAPFNVPYPAWLVSPLALAVLCLLARERGGPAPGVARFAAAGAIAALAGGCKPNAGLLLAGATAVVAALGDLAPGRPGPWRSVVAATFGLGAVALVWPPATTTLWWALVPASLALAAVPLARGAASREAGGRLVAAAAGFAAVSAACWGATFAALGGARFLREALLVGSGVAEVYALPYPWPALAGAAAALALLGARPRLACTLALVAVAAAVADAAATRPTAAGLVRLGVERAAMALLPLALAAGVVRLRRDGATALVAPTAVAVAMALQLHPRPDVAHVLAVAPGVLPLLAGLAAPRPAVALATGGLAAARLLPALGVVLAIVTGRVERVPAGGTTLVIEPAGAARLRALAAAADAVASHAGPDDRVVAFPACALVPFLAARRTAGAHDYFFPGRPTRAESAAMATALAADPPAVAVLCDPRGTDLVAAWTAHPEMTAFLADGYAPVATSGPFVVATRRSGP